MFVVRAATLLELLAQWHPALAGGLRDIAADQTRLSEIWPRLERIAIDHAVAEPAAATGRVAVVPATFGWNDIGDFASLRAILPAAAPAPLCSAMPTWFTPSTPTGWCCPAPDAWSR